MRCPVSRVTCHKTNMAWGPAANLWCTWYQAANSKGVPFWDIGTGWQGGEAWTMDLSQQPRGTWLISNYGEG